MSKESTGEETKVDRIIYHCMTQNEIRRQHSTKLAQESGKEASRMKSTALFGTVFSQ